MVGDEVVGFRHHVDCNCGCRSVVGLTGTVSEECAEIGVRIVKFMRPDPAGGPARAVTVNLLETGAKGDC